MNSSPSLHWMMVSLALHFFVIGPLLAGWVSSKPQPSTTSRSVSVHLSRPPRPQGSLPRLPKASKPQSTPASRPGPSSARPVSQNDVPPRATARRREIAPVSRPSLQSTSPVLPKIDSGEYPTAPVARGSGGRGSDSSRFRPGGQGRNPGETSPAPGSSRGHTPAVEVGPKIGRLPTNVPMPGSLRKLSIARMELKLEISVAVTGAAKVRLLESCGSSQLDRLLIDELERAPWIPATSDGNAIAKTFRLTVQGSLQPNTSTFSIVGMDSER